LAVWQVPPQLIVPLGHAQPPLTHCCPPPHAFPHDPQFALSVAVLVHVEPHTVGLAELGQAHAPALQLCADGHAWLHVPQLALSVMVLVQALPQKLGLAVVEHTHAPDWQVWLAAQTRPHAPQLPGSLVGVVHVPLQLVWPEAQPFVHAYVDPDGLHTGVAPEQPAPQPAQFVEVPRLVLQPVPVVPQSANPAAHWYVHLPAVHTSPVVPTCGSFEQLVPQAPQLLTSVPRTLTHEPLHIA